MDLRTAKSHLDSLIRKSKAHFYKPIHVAEVLHGHRSGQIKTLRKLEDYRSRSKRWRDEVCKMVLGRVCTSSAQYQDAVFSDRGCPPDALAALAEHNVANSGSVEAYIYGKFRMVADQVAAVESYVHQCDASGLSIAAMLARFDNSSQLGRSADRVFEICVAALLETMAESLRMTSCVTWEEATASSSGRELLDCLFGRGRSSAAVMPASLYRAGSTNAADGGVDIATNFGLAVQVKRRHVDAELFDLAATATLSSRLLLACDSFDPGLEARGAGRVAVVDRKKLDVWFSACAQGSAASGLKARILKGLAEEFPALQSFARFMSNRGYDKIRLAADWKTS